LNNTLPKKERLSGRSTIDRLFSGGKRFSVFPFRVIWAERTEPAGPPFRIGISVSKRISKLAVERNRIKRIIKDCYRTNKHSASETLTRQNKRIDFFLVYTGKIGPDTAEVRVKIILILKRLTGSNGSTAEQADNTSN